MKAELVVLNIALFLLCAGVGTSTAFALPDDAPLQIPGDAATSKFFAASVAFCVSAVAAGWAISRAGSAGLAGAAERPEIRTTAIIVSALGEAIAIYGIVIAILILGQPT